MKNFLLILFISIILSVEAQTQRSSTVAAEFQRINPCPANGNKTGTCPGYIKDHKYPLCAGGADAVENMMWQTVEAAKVKDILEKQLCACLRKHPK